ncbi:MAG: hypothetical protein B5M46_02315 [Epsilonproteobacteria bacterium 4484_20]|nr:MAG: hypothetical protein B5M46_02315 [Epsilonproteobacteria bacterium 4484_20]
MSRILFLHGFASCGNGEKSAVLKAYFGEKAVLAPDLPYAPLEVIPFLEEILEKEPVDLIIGSSLGGFYATWLAEKYRMRAVLLNPSTEPHETLKMYVGWQQRFCDGEIFEFKPVHIDQLKELKGRIEHGEYLVLLQSEDEILDYTKAHLLYEHQRVVIEYGGNHRFENIADYLCMIKNFKEKR